MNRSNAAADADADGKHDLSMPSTSASAAQSFSRRQLQGMKTCVTSGVIYHCNHPACRLQFLCDINQRELEDVQHCACPNGTIVEDVTESQTLALAKQAVDAHARQVAAKLLQQHPQLSVRAPNLARLVVNAFSMAINSTIDFDETARRTFVLTGGLSCDGPPRQYLAPGLRPPQMLEPMWVRDAVAQMHAYLPVLRSRRVPRRSRRALARIIEGFVEEVAEGLRQHPRAQSFKGWRGAMPHLHYEADSNGMHGSNPQLCSACRRRC